MVIEWTPDLAVGDAEIDGQHQELFRRAAALGTALDAGDAGAVAPLYEFLRGYAIDHFAREERLMRELAFPGFAVHRAAHDRFVRELEEVRRLFELAGPTAAIALRTRMWIMDWLVEHISFADRALARHVARATAASVPAPSPRPVALVLRR